MRYALLFLFALNANAMELGISLGQSYTGVADNGIWYQKGFPYSMDLAAGAYRVYTSMKPASWLRIEVDYADYGAAGGSASYVSDGNYTGVTSKPCYDPCESPRSAVWSGSSQALGISIIPEVRFSKLLVLPRIGYQYFQAETKVTAVNFHNNFVTDPNPSIGHYDESKNGYSWYYGIGAEYKGLKVEYTQSPLIKAGNDSIQRGVSFLGISYARSF